MKNSQKVLSLFLVLVIWITAVISVNAATQTKDGLDITVQTDKQKYEEDETITAQITVKNTNSFGVDNVSVECAIPSGYRAEGNSTLTIPTLASLEEKTLTVVLIPIAGSGPVTGDGSKVLLWSSAAILAGVVAVVCLRMRKNGSGMLAMFLCVTMLLSSLPLDSLKVQAAENETVTVQETVEVGSEELVIEVKVTYHSFAIAEETEESSKSEETVESSETEETEGSGDIGETEDYSETDGDITIYVSPNGDDSTGDGSEEKPYATIQKAKSAAAALKQENKAVSVIFKEGVYRIDSTVVFTAEDSGSEGAPIRYMAEEGADVVFTGAKAVDVTKFTPVTGNMLERIRPEVQDKVMQIDLGAQGFISFCQFRQGCSHSLRFVVPTLFINRQETGELYALMG